MRNFSREPATLHVTADGRGPTLHAQQATAPDRLLTAAATPRGRNLSVDSKVDVPVATGPFEVIDPVIR